MAFYGMVKWSAIMLEARLKIMLSDKLPRGLVTSLASYLHDFSPDLIIEQASES